MALLEVAHISKSFGETPVLHDVSFTADRGEIVCLLGPSGCGKTTLLRIVAGLEQADAGQVLFAGRDLIETPEQVAETIGRALKYVPAQRLFPCTNCGLAPMSRDVAVLKLQALGLGAALARERFGSTP